MLVSIFLSPWKIDFVILRSRGASLMYALQCNMSSDRGMTIIIIKSVYNLCSKHERSNRSRLLCRWTDIICQLCRKRVTIMVNRLMFFRCPVSAILNLKLDSLKNYAWFINRRIERKISHCINCWFYVFCFGGKIKIHTYIDLINMLKNVSFC